MNRTLCLNLPFTGSHHLWKQLKSLLRSFAAFFVVLVVFVLQSLLMYVLFLIWTNSNGCKIRTLPMNYDFIFLFHFFHSLCFFKHQLCNIISSPHPLSGRFTPSVHINCFWQLPVGRPCIFLSKRNPRKKILSHVASYLSLYAYGTLSKHNTTTKFSSLSSQLSPPTCDMPDLSSSATVPVYFDIATETAISAIFFPDCFRVFHCLVTLNLLIASNATLNDWSESQNITPITSELPLILDTINIFPHVRPSSITEAAVIPDSVNYFY